MNDRQEKFCQLYVQYGGNGKQAYIDAGYETEGNSAEVNASRLLRNAQVQMRISNIRVKHHSKFQVNQEVIIDRLCKIVFEGSTVAEIDENGELKLIPYADVDEVDGLSFSKSESSSRNESARGAISETSSSTISFSVKNKDKLKALDMLCKILGIYDKRETTDNGNFGHNAERVLDALRKLRAKNEIASESRE